MIGLQVGFRGFVSLCLSGLFCCGLVLMTVVVCLLVLLVVAWFCCDFGLRCLVVIFAGVVWCWCCGHRYGDCRCSVVYVLVVDLIGVGLVVMCIDCYSCCGLGLCVWLCLDVVIVWWLLVALLGAAFRWFWWLFSVSFAGLGFCCVLVWVSASWVLGLLCGVGFLVQVGWVGVFGFPCDGYRCFWLYAFRGC